MRIAHLVNPVTVPPTSDLHVAQPITFESMRRARSFAAAVVEVELLAAVFADDAGAVPEGFSATDALTRSILDLGRFNVKRRLPLLRDLLDRLHQASDAEYCVYTNVDIALMPYFYLSVVALIERGYDAFVINRRTVSRAFTAVSELPLMYASCGEPHPGHDCFVWRREAYPGYRLENICVGTLGVGKALLLNQLCTAQRWEEFRDLHLTFHLGADRSWLSADQEDYRRFNLHELSRIVDAYRREGRLPDHPLVEQFTRNLGV